MPDTTPPSIAIVNPADSSSVTGTVNITADARDDKAVVKVEFYIDAGLERTVSSHPWIFRWNTGVYANGSFHSIHALAYDGAGNSRGSPVIWVTMDHVPPAPVADLAVKSTTLSSISLTWSATGDDEDRGIAKEYDVRYYHATITESNWASATECTGEPTPQPSGSPECFEITGLKSNTSYSFGIKVADDALGFSKLSNVVDAKTKPLFAPRVDYPVGHMPSSVFAADFNRDGAVDLAVANYLSKNISVLMNNGDGTFQPRVDYGTSSGCNFVSSADLDGDGDCDLVTTNNPLPYPVPDPGSNKLRVFLNSGDGSFEPSSDYALGDKPVCVFPSDLDADGDNDLVVGCEESDSVVILVNNGDGMFEKVCSYAVESPSAVFCHDFDGDGDFDLVVVNNGAQGSVLILYNNGEGTFGAPISCETHSYPAGLFAADFNADGHCDLAVCAGFYWGTVSILLNRGDGAFGVTSSYEVGKEPVSMTSGDLDGDSDFDLAVANNLDNTVSLLLNNGDGTFQEAVSYITGGWPKSVCTADFNGDGYFDLAVANQFDDNVSILLNSYSEVQAK